MDLSNLIASWPFDPDTPSARIVRAADGSQKLQLRVDLGVLQMELKGRPDGTQPDGFPSVLHYYHDLEKNGNLPSALTDDECAVIHREAMQYFSRLNGFVALEWDRQTYDDAEHILDLLDLVSDLAASDETAWRVNQIYPFVRLHHARSAARLAANAARYSRARAILERAIDDIREYYANGADEDEPAIPGDDDPDAAPPEIKTLRDLLASLDSDQPLSEEENLQKALQSALEHENYEKAARLRDTLRRLRDSRPTRSPSSSRHRLQSTAIDCNRPAPLPLVTRHSSLVTLLLSFVICHLSFFLAVATRAAEPIPITLPSTANPFAPCLIRPLSIRFDSEMRAHRWAPIAIPDPPAFEPLLPGTTNPIPFSILVRDFTPDPGLQKPAEQASLTSPQSGRASEAREASEPLLLPCLPERMGRSGGMFSILRNGDALRFYGGLTHSPTSSLPPLEWQLLTDSRTSTRTFHFQIAAPTGPDRFIEIDFVMGPLDPDDPPRLAPLSHSAGYVGPVHSDMMVPYRSAHSPPVALVLDPSEPRDVAALYYHGEPVGFRVRLALTPSTGNFPRTATVAFDALPIEPRTIDDPFLLCPPDLPHAPDPLPVPQRILDGDLTGVPVFTPCRFNAPVPRDAFFDFLDANLDNPFAAAALQCPVRDSSLNPALQSSPFGIPSSRLLVNPDPDLKTSLSVGPNQALAILRAIDDLPAPPPAVLFRFDTLHVYRLEGLPSGPLDYSPSALHLCDFPAAWAPNDTPFRPAVSLAHAAAEFTATMACLLHRRGIPLLVTLPSSPARAWIPPRAAPYLAYHADAIFDLRQHPEALDPPVRIELLDAPAAPPQPEPRTPKS